jgi:hypothetical protein
MWSAVLSLKKGECNVMKEEPNTSSHSKPYEAPKLVRISLRPEEAVLGNCKNSSSAGPVTSGPCTMLGPCMSVGS